MNRDNNNNIFDPDYFDLNNQNYLSDSLSDNYSESIELRNGNQTEYNIFFSNFCSSNSDGSNMDLQTFCHDENFNYPKIINIDEEKEEPVDHKKIKETTTKDGKEICYTIDKIKKEIIPELDQNDEIKGLITKDEKEIEKIEKNLKSKKIPKEENVEITCGRKKFGDKSVRAHDRDSFDNVIKKVKKDFIINCLSFVNKILDFCLSENKKKALIKMVRNSRREPENKNILMDLDYDYINRLQKDFNLELLAMNLKELFSLNISKKYTALTRDSNKIIINKILEEEGNNEIINYVFGLRLIDWLNYFTHKTEIEFFDKIENEKKVKFERAEVLLRGIGEKENDSYYFSNYLFHLYNFKWWFERKKGRAPKKSKKQELSF